MSKSIKKLYEFLLSFPSYGWLVAFFLIPTLMVFTYGFKPFDFDDGVGPGWTLETFQNVLSKDNLDIIWRTIWLATLTTGACLALSLPMGYFLAQATPKVQKVFLLFIVMPFWSSFLVRIFAWKTLLHPEGFFKKMLIFFHIVGPETSLLYTLPTVLVVMIYSYLPFAVLPIYAASVRFNYQLIEAAMDLGAKESTAFFSVFIPAIKKGIITASVLVFIPSIGAYVIPDVVGGTSSEIIGNRIAFSIFIERNLPEASALSTILSLVVIVPIAISAFLHERGTKRNGGAL